MSERALGTISILTSNRQNSSAAMNKLLTDFGHHIMARMGVHVNRKCVENCPGLITLAVDSNRADLENIVKELNAIPEIKAELCILMEE